MYTGALVVLLQQTFRHAMENAAVAARRLRLRRVDEVFAVGSLEGAARVGSGVSEGGDADCSSWELDEATSSMLHAALRLAAAVSHFRACRKA